jgi:hypothetical protein
LTILCFATGCSGAPRNGQSLGGPAQGHAWHSVVVEPRPDLPRIHALNKVNPAWWVKNLDDPNPPEWYVPKGKLRKLRWYGRNSFHNFDFYVVGVADKRCVRSGRYPNDVGNPNGGWNYAVTQYKRLRLPFLSFQGKRVEWYIGWRNSGSFGLALRHSHRITPDRKLLSRARSY